MKNLKESNAAAQLHALSAKSMKLKGMLLFNKNYNYLMESYDNSFLALSSSIEIGKLKEFQELKEYFVSNISNVMPLIISNMLEGDIFAFSIYKELTSKIISYHDVHTDMVLKDEFAKYGGAEDGMAILNARHWLMTQDAVEIFTQHSQGHDVECNVGEMLGVVNEYSSCS